MSSAGLELAEAVAPATPAGARELAAARVVSPAPREVWEELLGSDRDSLPTQSPEWLDCVCKVTGARDASRLYDFGDGRRFVLPVARRGRPGLCVESSFSTAWGYGGLVGGKPTVSEVREVLADLRRPGVLSARVRPNPLHHDVWAAARPPGVVTVERRAHVLDLREGYDEIWRRRFTKNARTDVRRALRSGLRVEVDEDGRLLPVFWALFMRSVERWAGRQHEPLALARWRAARRDPAEKLATVMRDMGGMSRLWVAWAGRRPAAAILVLRRANVHDTRGVMDVDVARPTRANHLLQQLAIEDACRAGCQSYHMGETGDSASLAHYKESFGARPHVYAEYVAQALPFTRIDRGARSAVKRVLRFKDVG